MAKITSLSGPVERIGGKLMLRIPLSAGGAELLACSRGIGELDGEFLQVVIQDWLAERLGVSEGTMVVVDNVQGRFNIRRGD